MWLLGRGWTLAEQKKKEKIEETGLVLWQWAASMKAKPPNNREETQLITLQAEDGALLNMFWGLLCTETVTANMGKTSVKNALKEREQRLEELEQQEWMNT